MDDTELRDCLIEQGRWPFPTKPLTEPTEREFTLSVVDEMEDALL